MLVAALRDMGKCPCPRCQVEKKDIHLMGLSEDMAKRAANLRVDDADRRSRVEQAHQLIYESGLGVTSTAVEEQLKGLSLVPTKVRGFSNTASFLGSICVCLECLLRSSSTSRTEHVRHVRP
jgi:hypothetical protein